MEHYLSQLIKVEDAAQEVFELFASLKQHGDLGMLAPKETTLELSINGHDLTIAQSPGLLQSNNTQGTTGAAVWQSGVRFASWLAQPDNPLFQYGIITSSSVVLELGSGVAGVVSSILTVKLGHDGRIIASDMPYALKLLRQNLTTSQQALITLDKQNNTHAKRSQPTQVDVVELDWEQDDSKSLLTTLGLDTGVDVLIACDCVYNYALIKPFIETSASICALRKDMEGLQVTSCIIVQHLRQPDVLEEWLELTLMLFNVWRLPTDIVGNTLDEQSGLVVYHLTLR